MTYPLTTLVAEEVTNTGPEFGEASPIGLLIVVLLLIGVFVLVRSMNRHLKRVPQSFDAPDDADSREPPRESGG